MRIDGGRHTFQLQHRRKKSEQNVQRVRPDYRSQSPSSVLQAEDFELLLVQWPPGSKLIDPLPCTYTCHVTQAPMSLSFALHRIGFGCLVVVVLFVFCFLRHGFSV